MNRLVFFRLALPLVSHDFERVGLASVSVARVFQFSGTCSATWNASRSHIAKHFASMIKAPWTMPVAGFERAVALPPLLLPLCWLIRPRPISPSAAISAVPAPCSAPNWI